MRKILRSRQVWFAISITLATLLGLVGDRCFAVSSASGGRAQRSEPAAQESDAVSRPLDFEGLPDSTAVTNQYPNAVFSHATAITAGLSLNELEVAPHSGSVVVFDDGGPMLISFAVPITSLAGYFTYSSKISLIAFDEKNVQVAITTSKFSSSFALSGDAGASMNELLSLSYKGGIKRVLITGAAGGSSFALDDVTVRMEPAKKP